MKSRRKFIISSLAALTGIVLVRCTNKSNKKNNSINDKFDILSYCCIPCDERCEGFKATKYNDVALKTKLAKQWGDKDGTTYSVDQIKCFGCKNEDTNNNHRLLNCTVRKCVKGKGLISCAHCNELTSCDKNLWVNWPSVRDNALKIQKELQS